jgi:NAD(P)-dependent dehydrogenase (short-subunit alcohol dehydrogenase family)
MPEAMSAVLDPGLKGKVAIVTGGGAADDGIGNGRAAAMLLAQAGTRVLVVDMDRARADRTVHMIREIGGAAQAFAGDVTSEDDCARMAAVAKTDFGRIDVLDNNVGIGGRGSVLTVAPDDWRKVMRVNVDSMYMTSRAVIPVMIETAGGGAIVNVSSIAALRPRGLTPYTTSKGAVISLTRAMAVDHGKDHIRVNCVAPGPVFTPMVYADGMTDEARERRRKASILGMEGSGWDVGHAVRFLLSSHARYITGQTLIVDGGVTVQAPARNTDRG